MGCNREVLRFWLRQGDNDDLSFYDEPCGIALSTLTV
jgi:hypothetical protein